MKNQKQNDVMKGNKESEEMELQSLEKKNPYDLSFGSIESTKLKHFILLKLTSAISDVMSESFEEVARIRSGTFEFSANEIDTSKESDYSTIEAYAESQIEAWNSIDNNFERASMSMISKFNDDFGKTEHIDSLQSK